jgi:hypothetical protein
MSNSINIVSLQSYCESNDLVQVSGKTVRTNSNGYPFITFMDKGNEAHNIYFSKAEAENVSESTPINMSLLSALKVSMAETKENGKLPKLTKGSDNRLDLDW